MFDQISEQLSPAKLTRRIITGYLPGIRDRSQPNYLLHISFLIDKIDKIHLRDLQVIHF